MTEDPRRNLWKYYDRKHKDQELAITAAYLTGDYTMKEIGDHYWKHYSTINRIIKQNE